MAGLLAAFLRRGDTSAATRRSSGWHPHFGQIGGKTLAEWLDSAPRQTVRHSIVVASGERTGSEWLCQLMGQTNRLGRPAEYLNTPWLRRFIADYPDDVAAQIAIAHRMGTTENGCFAMKLHPWHFDRLAKAVAFADAFPMARFVRILRQDLLAQAISLFRARQTDCFYSSQSPAGRPEFDAAGIARVLSELVHDRARWDLYFARNGIRPLILEYENLAASPAHCVQQIGEFVGEAVEISPADALPDLKIQRDDLSAEWRARFLATHRNLNRMDPLCRAVFDVR